MVWRRFGGALSRGILLTTAAMALALPAQAAEVQARPSLYDPSLSPDGREIAFVSGGDIWTAPAAGGTAHLLISNPATEGHPLYSPDGTKIAFTSTRDGPANIYLLTLASGEITRLTWSNAGEELDGWSRDGKWLYFSSNADNIDYNADVYRVSAAGGTALPVSAEAYINEFDAAPSPDGSQIALMAKGISSLQWWRDGHAHIDEAELWIKPITADAPYRRLLGPTAKHLWPMWSPDGATLYYMSDESGSENIWKMPAAGGTPQQVTRFTSGRVLFPRISQDGASIVFERDFGIWKLDTASGQAAPVEIALRGAPAAAGERHLSASKFDEMALSPDGKKLAVVAHGQVFATTAKDGGPGERISTGDGAASDLVWSPDSKKLLFVQEDGLDTELVEYDFAKAKAQRLTTGAGTRAGPAYSPDGKQVAYRNGRSELRLISFAPDGAVARDTLLFNGMRDIGGPDRPVWSPDGKWLAFAVTDPRSFRNVYVVPAAGGEPKPVSFLANGETANVIAWSPDGKYLIFDTAQRSEETHLVRVDLLPHVPKYREDEFRDLFKPGETPDRKTQEKSPAHRAAETPADQNEKAEAGLADADKPAHGKPKVEPVKIDFDGIRERATFIPLGLSAEHPVISPDGKTLVFRAAFAGQPNLYSYDLDELKTEPAVPKQITTTHGPKRFFAFTPDSKDIYLLDAGHVVETPVAAPKPKPVAIDAEMNVDFSTEKQVVFDEAWETLNRMFFDPHFHGQDWNALRLRFEPYVEGAQTPDELRRDINLMIGELDASHSGINAPREGFGSTPRGRIGDLGLMFDRTAYESGHGLVVSHVVGLGPADLSGEIHPGDRLLAVDGRRIGPETNLGELLLDKGGKRTVLSVASLTAKAEREVVVRPVSGGVAEGLRYRDWVEGRRAYVAKVSGGRLGYVHLQDMSSDALNQLYLDLDAQNEAKDGVVIDVRNNDGGFVNGYVLDVFTRKNFLMMTPRGLTAMPSRQALGQRALGLPTVLVTNESSLSDSEDFTEGYRALHLGKVVGVPTAGWIIYTSEAPLIDGSSVRMPFIRVQDAEGQDMEMHPRPVDVMVEEPLGGGRTGRDPQLDAAVQVLLQGLPAQGK